MHSLLLHDQTRSRKRVPNEKTVHPMQPRHFISLPH